MTREDWRDLTYCISVAGVILTTLLIVFSIPPHLVRLLS